MRAVLQAYCFADFIYTAIVVFVVTVGYPLSGSAQLLNFNARDNDSYLFSLNPDSCTILLSIECQRLCG